MQETSPWSGGLCPPDELERRAGELARAWAAMELSAGAENVDEEIRRAESLIRWLAGMVSGGSATPGVLAARVDELSQMLVHELKNPLSQVQMGVDMLANRIGGTEEDLLYLGWVERGVARAVEVLEDVRLLGVVEATESERWMPVERVIADVLGRVQDHARRAGVECSVEGDLPEGVIDAAHVGMALGNLVANAVKYSDSGKPERWVRVRVDRITGVVNGLRFTVADNGLGIPDRVQRDVFSRHFRGHPDVATGMGLGLAITKQVIERRRGQIWFHSEEGTGSVFHFVIPDRIEPEPLPIASPMS